MIAVFLLAVAGISVFFWISVSAPIQPQQALPYHVKEPAFPVLPLAALFIALLGFFIWISALIHMLTSRALQATDKILWAIVIILLNVLGAILYFTIRPFAGAKGANLET